MHHRSWERQENYTWPSDKPVCTYSAFAICLALFALSLWFDFSRWTPLQQYWLPTYLSVNVLPKFGTTSSQYRLLVVSHPDRKAYLPTAEDVEPGLTRSRDGRRIPFVLTDSASSRGYDLLLEPPRLWDNAFLRDMLRVQVYEDHSLLGLTWPAALSSALVLIFALLIALPADKRRARIRKYGRRIKGPEEVTAANFNYRCESDGAGFLTLEKPSIADRIWRREWQHVRIPRQLEDSHFEIMGDSGVGKSALIRQLLLQVNERAASAIVYDPALEYTAQFYHPERGDVILNPLDRRMPYWSPSNEIVRPAEALTLAAALFPDTPRENPFFVEGPRKIFAHLLTLKLTVDELIWCLTREEELDRKLKGTELASLIYPGAGQQRGGILASLSLVADSLKLLPAKEETSSLWSAAEWARQRQGWIFITSLPSTRKQLRPLISMWLDMLILRLMNEGKHNTRPVWFVLDELASLHHLPQLHTAVTENRKCGNPLVLGFQGRSQIEAIYGHVAEAMFSQPATKIFLRTSEPNAAQWISGFIGNVELERLRETRSDSQMPPYRETRSFQMEHEIRPLVMKEEISGLDKGHGFLKCGNLVVRFSFPYVELPNRHPDFLEREMRVASAQSLRNSQPKSMANGDGEPRAPQTQNGTTPPLEQDSGHRQEPSGFIK